jgi:hypothetical protein
MVTLIKHPSLQKSVSKFMPKTFYEINPWSWSYKILTINFLTLFCKLNLSIAMKQKLLIFMKWPSLLKIVSKFVPKTFYEINPWLNWLNHVLSHLSNLPCLLIHQNLSNQGWWKTVSVNPFLPRWDNFLRSILRQQFTSILTKELSY